MKVCNACKQERPLTEFWANRTTDDGLQGRCKECFRRQRQTPRGAASSIVRILRQYEPAEARSIMEVAYALLDLEVGT